MSGKSKSNRGRRGRDVSRWVHFGILPALLLATAPGSRSGAASAPAYPTPASSPAASSASPALGAASAGWLDSAQRDLKQREYELSWQASPAADDVEASWHAPNRSQNFRTYFTSEGIRVVPRTGSTPSWRWGLSLVGYGRGEMTWVVPQATLSPSGHRIDYHRGSLDERYENTPGGLEQIFTLSAPPGQGHRAEGEEKVRGWTTAPRRPAGTAPASEPDPHADPGGEEPSDLRDWVHLDLALWGDLSPRVSEDGQAIDFVTPSGAPVLRYAQLKVTDARGEILPAWMEGFAGEGMRGIRLVIDAREAVYPLTVDPLATSVAWTAESNQAGAQFGWAVGTAGDVNGDGYSDVIVGASGYDNGQTEEGRAFVYYGSASGLSLTPDWTAESDQATANLGLAVGTAGDVNGDGYSDVIVGAPLYDNGQTDEGRAFVYHGSASGPSPTPDWTSESDQPVGWLGRSVGTAGDVNGDGYSDVIVGAHVFDQSETDEGRALVFHGSASGLSLTPDWTAEANQVNARFGISVGTAGDVNGDGYSDVVVGAYLFDNGQTDEGRAFVYHGSATGLSTTSNWTAEADLAGAEFGRAVSTAGDVNGDGYADVIVGSALFANGQAGEGRAFLYRGSASGLSPTPQWTDESNQAFAEFGFAVGTAGDVNGDGYADVIVGARSYDNGQADEGRAFVFLGSPAGLVASAAWTAESDQAGAQFAFSVATAGDVNGDGYSDVLVGAWLYDNGQTDEGRAFVFLGSASGLVTITSSVATFEQGGNQLGYSVASAGDVNGDGYSDVIVGAPFHDNGQADEGRAGLYLGSIGGCCAFEEPPAWTAESDQVNALFGASVASAGDVNGDGYSDVLVGAPHYDSGQTDEGRVSLYLGSASGLETSPTWTAESDQAGAEFGTSVATAGDVNGDGYSDVLVGANLYDNPQADEGRAYLYRGSPSGLATSPAWTAESDQVGAEFGTSVATAGDVNRDGYSDVLVGAPFYDNTATDEGRAYLYLSSASALATSPSWTAESHDGGFDQPGALFGASVATAGDVNGDGYSDVIVGAPHINFGSTLGGRAYVYHGLGSGSGLTTSPVWTEAGDRQSFSQFGTSVATAGDVNGDGYADVIVGAPTYSDIDFQVGRAYVYLGSDAGLATAPGSAWGPDSNYVLAHFGTSVAAAGDVNGDGYADVIVGAIGDAPPIDPGARAFIYHGGGGAYRARIPRQARTDASTPIALLGKSDSETGLALREQGQTAAGRGKIRLQWEVKPLGTPFDGTGLGASSVVDTGSPAVGLGSAVSFNEAVTGLGEGTFYHWRSRIVSSDPFFPRSPWMSLAGNNVTETKLRTAGCVDRDGDAYGVLSDPSCLSLVLDCNDESASAWGTPGETLNLRFTSGTTLDWDPPAAPGAPTSDLLYDTLRAVSPDGFLSASCLESDDGPDTTATDGTIPSVGQVFFYLTRAQNACPQGVGTLGTNSSGAPRAGVDCP